MDCNTATLYLIKLWKEYEIPYSKLSVARLQIGQAWWSAFSCPVCVECNQKIVLGRQIARFSEALSHATLIAKMRAYGAFKSNQDSLSGEEIRPVLHWSKKCSRVLPHVRDILYLQRASIESFHAFSCQFSCRLPATGCCWWHLLRSPIKTCNTLILLELWLLKHNTLFLILCPKRQEDDQVSYKFRISVEFEKPIVLNSMSSGVYLFYCSSKFQLLKFPFSCTQIPDSM